MSKDSLLFDVGFNTCDISQFENILSKNLKFYHDKDGISTKEKFLFDLQKGLCKNPKIKQAKRVLVKESTQIFPLFRNDVLYGAIQYGEHLFYEKPEIPSGKAKFTHVWEQENGDWKLVTSLSFDHQAYEPTQSLNAIFDNRPQIEKWLKAHHVPALGIGIIQNGQLQQVDVFGVMAKDKPAPYNTIFNVASLTKPVTAIVALKLVSLGKWNLDQPLHKYWTDPDIASDARHEQLTTRLVLSHQTGLPNWRGDSPDHQLHFLFEPGTQYQYSGEGFEYLRKALEKKFKKSLQQLADELIFKPTQMTDTQYIWDDKIDTSRMATGYDTDGRAYATVKRSTPNAADDLLTTIQDYGKFLVSVLQREGLSEKVWEEMTSHQVASTHGKHFGLGFEIYDLDGGDYALSHGGADEGVRTLVFIFPKTQKGLLIFTNSDVGGSLYEDLVKYYLGKNGQKIIDIETK